VVFRAGFGVLDKRETIAPAGVRSTDGPTNSYLIHRLPCPRSVVVVVRILKFRYICERNVNVDSACHKYVLPSKVCSK
jgi:hypothetical protein